MTLTHNIDPHETTLTNYYIQVFFLTNTCWPRQLTDE